MGRFPARGFGAAAGNEALLLEQTDHAAGPIPRAPHEGGCSIAGPLHELSNQNLDYRTCRSAAALCRSRIFVRPDCRRDRAVAQRRHRKNPSSASVAGRASHCQNQDAATAPGRADAASHPGGRVRASRRRGANDRERRAVRTRRPHCRQMPLADRRSGRKRFLLLRQPSRRRPVLLRRPCAPRLPKGGKVTVHAPTCGSRDERQLSISSQSSEVWRAGASNALKRLELHSPRYPEFGKHDGRGKRRSVSFFA